MQPKTSMFRLTINSTMRCCVVACRLYRCSVETLALPSIAYSFYRISLIRRNKGQNGVHAVKWVFWCVSCHHLLTEVTSHRRHKMSFQTNASVKRTFKSKNYQPNCVYCITKIEKISL